MLAVRKGVEGERKEAVVSRSNTRSNINVAKPPAFNKKKNKILGFLTAYKFYIRIKVKDTSVEKQIQCVLSYI